MKNVTSGGRTTDRLGSGQAFQEHPLILTELAGTIILPPARVAKQSAVFPTITRESILRDIDVRRQAGAAFARDTHDVDELSYSCQGYGLEHPVTRQQREVYASDYDVDQAAQRLITLRLRRAMEIRHAAAIFNATTWTGASLQTDVTTDWDTASATIVSDLLAACEKVRQNCGMWPTHVLLSAAHRTSLINNTDLNGRIQYTSMPSLRQNVAALSEIIMVPNIVIAGTVKGTHKEGGTLAISDVWSDDYCWVGVVPEDETLESPGVGHTIFWEAESGAGDDGIVFDMYEETQTKTTIYRGEHWVQEKVLDPYFGHLLVIDT